MKILTFKSVFLALIVTLLFAGCQEDEYEIGEPFSKLEGINGSWEISQVNQVDFTNRPVFDISIDVSELIIGSDPMSINFNSETTKYTIEAGTTSNLLGDGGNWYFDDDQFPTAITFVRNDGTQTTVQMIGTVRIVDNELRFEISKDCSSVESPEFGYEYVFQRVTQ